MLLFIMCQSNYLKYAFLHHYWVWYLWKIWPGRSRKFLNFRYLKNLKNCLLRKVFTNCKRSEPPIVIVSALSTAVQGWKSRWFLNPHSPTMRYFLPNLSTMSARMETRDTLADERGVTSLVTLMQTARATGWNWGNARRWPVVFLFLSLSTAATNTHTALHTEPASAHHYFVSRGDNNTLCLHRCVLHGLLEKSTS